MVGTERDPRLGELERVVEIGERVELHRPVSPLALDARAQIGREPGRLLDVAFYDLLIHMA
jgi:hypothetical protein